MASRKIRWPTLVDLQVVPEGVARFLAARSTRRRSQHVRNSSANELAEGDTLLSGPGNRPILQGCRENDRCALWHNYAYILA